MNNSEIIYPYRTIKVLILEDVPEDARLMQHELEKASYIVKPKVVDDEEGFVHALMNFHPDIILADYSLPTFSGLEALIISRKRGPKVPFVFVTGAVGEEIAAETIVSGASGFVLKSNLPKLSQVVGKIFHEQGGWRNQRFEYTNQRIKARIEANLEALERIRSFIEKSNVKDPAWSDAMQGVAQLKENLSRNNSLPEEGETS